MASKKNKLKLKICLWATIIGIVVWTLIPNPTNFKVIIPWCFAIGLFICYKWAKRQNKVKERVRRVKRYNE